MLFRTSTTLPDKAPPRGAPVTAPTGVRSYAFPRTHRVTRGPEIEQVRKEGKRVRTASMDVRAIASLRACARVGIIVPKYGHSSVARNLVKRRLRELVRVEVLPMLPAIDVVLRAAPRAYTRAFPELRDEVRKWARQLATFAPLANSTTPNPAMPSPTVAEPSRPAEP